jgi:putative NIF3 family GTP cyclohydrolase 1 type 2
VIAKQVAGRVAALGEDAVEIYGDANAVVSKVGVGTGCATNPSTFQAMGCDVSIVSDDGTSYWKQLQQAEDEGHPFIRVNHGVSEEPGMITLADFVRKNIPQLDEVKYLPHKPFYRTVMA